MSSEEISGQIRLLVDHLREKETIEHSLTDVASVTEVLISTMRSYFKSVDTSIYRECRALSEYISNAREEIASLSPSEESEDRIPRAGLELDAIVQATEEATNTIMTSAEEIMTILGEDDLNSHKDKIEAAVMNMFEACSFQDITGQRISKVVETLGHIEGRVAELRDLMGVTDEEIKSAKKRDLEKELEGKHDKLARGPSLESEGVDQDDVDAMFASTAAEDATGTESAEEVKAEATPAPKPAPAPAVAAPEPAPEPEPEPAPEPAASEEVGQDDIDAMFAAHSEVDEESMDDASEETEAEKELSKKEEINQDDIDALFN